MDSIKRFLFKDLNIRGQHVHLNEAWQKMIEDRHYPPALTEVLGELTAMAVIMANGLKHPGKITIQVQGQGPVNLLVVEATHELKIKGVAKTNETITDQNTLGELLGDGNILVTMENTLTDSFFQSFVERKENSVARSFENFLSQSEQQPSKLWLAADDTAIGGVVIQKLPETDEIDGDGWNRITTLSDTLKDEELLTLDTHTLLHRLFHEETIELFEPQHIEYDCPQDPRKIEQMVKALGEEEARKIIEEQGEIVVHNEMCNFHLRLTAKDLDRIFETPTH